MSFACMTIRRPFEGCWPLAAVDIRQIAATPLIFLRGAPRHYGFRQAEPFMKAYGLSATLNNLGPLGKVVCGIQGSFVP